MKKPKYAEITEKMKEKLIGKSGVIQINHSHKMNEMSNCQCENIMIVSEDNKHNGTSIFSYRHCFKDRVIEPFEDTGFNGATAYMKNGLKVVL